MPSLSAHPYLDSSSWLSLPSKPGIYIFKNGAGEIIYVGKAKSLKDRVSWYFRGSGLGAKTQMLVSQVKSIEHIEVGSEIEALLLEAQLIKKHQPRYNLISKDDKSPYYIHLTQETYPKPVINHQPQGSLAGPFLSARTARSILKQFRTVAPYCLGKRASGRPCLYSHLRLCSPCPCVQLDAAESARYQANIAKLRRLLSGKFSQVMTQLRTSMRAASTQLEYEKAAQIRNQINHLEYLLQKPLAATDYITNPNLSPDLRQDSLQSLQLALAPFLRLPSLARIELYDNAHLHGSSPTSAMTVAQDGELRPDQYRHFTLGKKADYPAFRPDDLAYMLEVLQRRFAHSDWPVPDLIVLDGGRPQLSILPRLHASPPSSGQLPPVIAIAKKAETLVIPLSNAAGEVSGYHELNLPLAHPGLRLLIQLRNEAHRFSRRLHHRHQSQKMLR